jgi:hypothetical protein
MEIIRGWQASGADRKAGLAGQRVCQDSGAGWEAIVSGREAVLAGMRGWQYSGACRTAGLAGHRV